MNLRDRLIGALESGARTATEVGAALGISRSDASDMLAYLALRGAVFSRVALRDRGASFWRYGPLDAPDILVERRARVERMRGWAPAALVEMRRASTDDARRNTLFL